MSLPLQQHDEAVEEPGEKHLWDQDPEVLSGETKQSRKQLPRVWLFHL